MCVCVCVCERERKREREREREREQSNLLLSTTFIERLNLKTSIWQTIFMIMSRCDVSTSYSQHNRNSSADAIPMHASE
jgi:hypothetical protein